MEFNSVDRTTAAKRARVDATATAAEAATAVPADPSGSAVRGWTAEAPGLNAGCLKTGSTEDQGTLPGALPGTRTKRPGSTKDSGAGIPDEGISFDAHSPTGCVQYNVATTISALPGADDSDHQVSEIPGTAEPVISINYCRPLI